MIEVNVDSAGSWNSKAQNHCTAKARQNLELSMSELRYLLASVADDEASSDLGRHEEGASRKSGGALSPTQLLNLNCLAT